MPGEKLRIAPNCAAGPWKPTSSRSPTSPRRPAGPSPPPVIGSSPIRPYAEDWTLESIAAHTRKAVEFAVKNDIE